MFDARELWRNILEVLRPIALEKSIRVTERIPDAPLMVFGDKQELREVFTNLVFNSVKFTDRGGEIIVELAGKAGEATMMISDTGVGIPAEVLDQSFSATPQAEASPSSIRDSLRVGLLVVQDIIRLHGGQISVSSRNGGGVTFLITLPVF